MSEAMMTGKFLGFLRVFGGGSMSFTCVMTTAAGAASGDANGDLCILLLFWDMVFFRFNFSATAGRVSPNGAATTSAMDVDGAVSWLPSVLPQRLAVVVPVAQGLGAGLSNSSMASFSCGFWLPSWSYCSRARMKAMLSCSRSDIRWAVLAAVAKSLHRREQVSEYAKLFSIVLDTVSGGA